MYNPKSKNAEEFICHDEVLASLEYAEKNKNNLDIINKILEKARLKKGLSHREAAVLLDCTIPEKVEEIFALAREIKQEYYGNRIVLFAPLYLSNYCVNGCVYCPYHHINKHIPRVKLTQEQIKREVEALQDMGHKRIAIESGEDPVNNPIEYILDSIKTIYSVKHKNGAIRRVNVNIAATTVENYKKLHEAGIGTYILFQETYNKETYEKLHPTGPKHNYKYHTEAMDRAMEAGIDDVSLGVLGPHAISVPRIKKADDIDPSAFDNGIDDDTFAKITACIRIAVPYTGMIISTRESAECRARLLKLGVSQISGGSKTSVGGYFNPAPEDENSAQFDVSDRRPLDDVIKWLIELGYLPSFCTSCYRQGRTGDRFMEICKSQQIHNYCQPNAVMTLKEYLEDYASPVTKAVGEKLLPIEIAKIKDDKIRTIVEENLIKIHNGERDFKF